MRHLPLPIARARYGLSQAELARETHLSRNTIWRLETGRTLPSYETREALERALGCKLAFSRDAS